MLPPLCCKMLAAPCWKSWRLRVLSFSFSRCQRLWIVAQTFESLQVGAWSLGRLEDGSDEVPEMDRIWHFLRYAPRVKTHSQEVIESQVSWIVLIVPPTKIDNIMSDICIYIINIVLHVHLKEITMWWFHFILRLWHHVASLCCNPSRIVHRAQDPTNLIAELDEPHIFILDTWWMWDEDAQTKAQNISRCGSFFCFASCP